MTRAGAGYRVPSGSWHDSVRIADSARLVAAPGGRMHAEGPFCAVAALARSEPAVVAVGRFETRAPRGGLQPPFLVATATAWRPPVVRRRRAVLGNVLVVVYGERYRVGRLRLPGRGFGTCRCLRSAATGSGRLLDPGRWRGRLRCCRRCRRRRRSWPAGRPRHRAARCGRAPLPPRCPSADRPRLADAVSQVDGVCPGSPDGSGMVGFGRDSVLASPVRRVHDRLKTWPVIAVVRAVRGWR